MLFDFDTPVERRRSGSTKWEKYRDIDVLPLWLADMDFRSPPAVIEALHRRVEHGVYGYTQATEELVGAICHRMLEDYGWPVDPEWIVWLPGLVTGLNVTCRSAGEDGDDILTAVPVYPPFLTAPGYSRRNLNTVSLMEKDGLWTFDYDALEAAVTDRTRLFILCNPHNPVGRIYTREELLALSSICEKHNIIICSDEIHCSLLLDSGKPHIPTATLDPEIARRTITLMAPSKTYNLPGLGCSFAIISDPRLRRNFIAAKAGIVPHVNVFGYAAALAAYTECGEWHAALLEYLRSNRDLLEAVIEGIEGLSMGHVEATYLAWISTHKAGMDNPAGFFERAGVGLNDGRDFGGPGFVRLNFGCSKATLAEALERIKRAMEKGA
ncbi:MAG TPA: putative C-S lyase [Desulfobacteraceae bacterium]|nr:putative C-S lyase [Desulfobacteraceae bacterium]